MEYIYSKKAMVYWSLFVVFTISCPQLICGQGGYFGDLTLNVDELVTRTAEISANATCGEYKSERYCRLVEHSRSNQDRWNYYSGADEKSYKCDDCDSRIPEKNHNVRNALADDNGLWWQSPSLAEGRHFEKVDVVIDLKQVYQVMYVFLQTGDSMLPAQWILERSLDNVTYHPWIYYADSNAACRKFNSSIRYTKLPVPANLGDDEVYCTTYYSKLRQVRNVEIVITLTARRDTSVNANLQRVSQTLVDFLSARFIRLRFQKILTLAGDNMIFGDNLEADVFNRYYYSLRSIRVGSKCICYDHAPKCVKQIIDGVSRSQCECEHDTEGSNCERCKPMYNQKLWAPGKPCEECNCHNKAYSCTYNSSVELWKESKDKLGAFNGGGVCINCRDNTAGINCDSCKPGFYRPEYMSPADQYPCQVCQCHGKGSLGTCEPVKKEGKRAGECLCKEGYTGTNCDKCADGYEMNTATKECEACPCNVDGGAGIYRCTPPCNCKVNVEGNCDQCKLGFFNLQQDNPVGCQPCFCFNITNTCKSTDYGQIEQKVELTGWGIATPGSQMLLPITIDKDYRLNAILAVVPYDTSYFFAAPDAFLGNKLTLYGRDIETRVDFMVNKNYPFQINFDPDLLLTGFDGTRISYRSTVGIDNNNEAAFSRKLLVNFSPNNWEMMYAYPPRAPTQKEFMTVLANITQFLIRARYTTNTIQVKLGATKMTVGHRNAVGSIPSAEMCNCPPGYDGNSCESCKPGYRRVNKQLWNGKCERCECNGHSLSCDAYTGYCSNCQNNTAGNNCELCAPGYVGDATRPNGCQKCACPYSDYQQTDTCDNLGFQENNEWVYFCTSCQNNTMGQKCDRCKEGYFGDPMKRMSCERCQCNNNEISCNPVTGECNCGFNTQGTRCNMCIEKHFGDPLLGECQKCDCDPKGAFIDRCHIVTGKCKCNMGYDGRKCDTCAPGYGNVTLGCPMCQCDPVGTVGGKPDNCDQVTGQCQCHPGIGGPLCDKCLDGFKGFSNLGCEPCGCSNHSLSDGCDAQTGQCECGSNVVGLLCDQCKSGAYWLNRTHCQNCNCNVNGSLSFDCDLFNGQCPCKPTINGRQCDVCIANYYGHSAEGCKECPSCKTGSICDKETGKCICPPNTVGTECEKCHPEAWGYNTSQGCQKCNCSITGSLARSCSDEDGQCVCKPEFQGLRCQTCKPGYYGYPNCRKCQCSDQGTREDQRVLNSTTTLFMCDAKTGACVCTGSAAGHNCDECPEGTYGPVQGFRTGCPPCYCSEKSTTCKLKTTRPSIKTVNKEHMITIGSPPVGYENNAYIIPPDQPAEFKWPLNEFYPLYIEIPEDFTKDLTYRYGMKAVKVSYKCQPACEDLDITMPYPHAVLAAYHNSARLIYNAPKVSEPDADGWRSYDVILREDMWTLTRWKKAYTKTPLSSLNVTDAKGLFMFPLHYVNQFKVLVYPPNSKDRPNAVFFNYTLLNPGDNGNSVPSTTEVCDCPEEFIGDHCEIPAPGYFVPIKPMPKTIIIAEPGVDTIYPGVDNGTDPEPNPSRTLKPVSPEDPRNDMIFPYPYNTTEEPKVEPCKCNNFSTNCDAFTGFCVDCTNNTAGPSCDLCTDGYYGKPAEGIPCTTCLCPSVNASFATGCKNLGTDYICHCKQGYSGVRCDKCEEGFFGSPLLGTCRQCDCSVQGSLNSSCDDMGQCNCATGIQGLKCDQCAKDYAVVNMTCKNCRAGCTREMYEVMDEAEFNLNRVNITDAVITAKRLQNRLNDGLTDTKNRHIKDITDLGKKIQPVEAEIRYIKNKTDKMVDNNPVKKRMKSYNDFKTQEAKILQLKQDAENWINRDFGSSASGNRSLDEMQNDAKALVEKMKQIAMDNEMDKNTTSEVKEDWIEFLASLKEFEKSFATISTIQDLADRLNKLSKQVDEMSSATSAHTIVIKNAETDMKDLETQAKKLRRGLPEIEKQNNESIANLNDANQNYNYMKNTTDVLLKEASDVLNGVSNLPWSPLTYDNYQDLLGHRRVKKLMADDSVNKLMEAVNGTSKARLAMKAYTKIADSVDEAIINTKEAKDIVDDVINNKYPSNWDPKTSEINIRVDALQKLLDAQPIDTKSAENQKNKYNEVKNKSDNLDADLSKYEEQVNQLRDVRVPNITNFETTTNVANQKNKGDIDDLTNKLETDQILVDRLKNETDELRKDFHGAVADVNEMEVTLHNETDDTTQVLYQLNETFSVVRSKLDNIVEIHQMFRGASSNMLSAITFESKCVRTMETYMLPKSSFFELELGFKVKAKVSVAQLMLFGQRLSNKMVNFALVIHPTKLSFTFSTGSGIEELKVDGMFNRIGADVNWYRVVINVFPSKATMSLHKFEMETMVFTEVGSSDSQDLSHSGLILDPDSLIFLGGKPSIESRGTLADHLSAYDYYIGCMYSLKLQKRIVGMDDVVNYSGQCAPTDMGRKACKVHLKMAQQITISDHVVWSENILVDRSYRRFYELHTGQDYLRVDPYPICKEVTYADLPFSMIHLPTINLEEGNIRQFLFALVDIVTYDFTAFEYSGQTVYNTYKFGNDTGSYALQCFDTLSESCGYNGSLTVNGFKKRVFYTQPNKKSIGSAMLKQIDLKLCTPNKIIYVGGIPNFRRKLRSLMANAGVKSFAFIGQVGIKIYIFDVSTRKQVLGISTNVRFGKAFGTKTPYQYQKWRARWIQFTTQFSGSGYNLKLSLGDPIFRDPFQNSISFTFSNTSDDVLLLNIESTNRIKEEIRVSKSGSKLTLVIASKQITTDLPSAYTHAINIVFTKASDNNMIVTLYVDNVAASNTATVKLFDSSSRTQTFFIGPIKQITRPLCFNDLLIGMTHVDFRTHGVNLDAVNSGALLFHLCPKAFYMAPMSRPDDVPVSPAVSTRTGNGFLAKRHVIDPKCDEESSGNWITSKVPTVNFPLTNLLLQGSGPRYSIAMKFVTVASQSLRILTAEVGEETVAVVLDRGNIRVRIGSNPDFLITRSLNDGRTHTLRVEQVTLQKKDETEEETTHVIIDEVVYKMYDILSNNFQVKSVVVGAKSQGDGEDYYMCIRDVKVNGQEIKSDNQPKRKCLPCILVRNDVTYIRPDYAVQREPRYIKVDWNEGITTGFALSFMLRLANHKTVVLFTTVFDTAEKSTAVVTFIRSNQVIFTIATFNDKDLLRKDTKSSNVISGLTVPLREWIQFKLSGTEPEDMYMFSFTAKQETTYADPVVGEIGLAGLSNLSFYWGRHPRINEDTMRYIVGTESEPYVGCVRDIQMTNIADLTEVGLKKLQFTTTSNADDLIVPGGCTFNEQPVFY